MLFVLGVLMLVIGIGFCLMGNVKLPGGRILRPKPARISGGVLLSFIPLAMIVHFVFDPMTSRLFMQIIHWSLAILCFAVVFVIIVKTTQPARRQRTVQEKRSLKAAERYFEDDPTTDDKETADQPLANDPLVDHAKQIKNPFDFS